MPLTTTAEKIEKYLNGCPQEADGFKEESAWEEFYGAVLRIASSTRKLCPESCDSSVLVAFRDGSAVRVDNPRQQFFSAQCCVEN